MFVDATHIKASANLKKQCKKAIPSAARSQTIERVFADAKEKHGMCYTHHRGLAHVTNWVRLKFAAMNLKKLAIWRWKERRIFGFCRILMPFWLCFKEKELSLA